MYGSAGATTTLLARIVLGGYAKVLHTPALARAAATVLRKVVMAAVISQPYLQEKDTEPRGRARMPLKYCSS
jgi:hypothetical protein